MAILKVAAGKSKKIQSTPALRSLPSLSEKHDLCTFNGFSYKETN